jgi:hypothetical protein
MAETIYELVHDDCNERVQYMAKTKNDALKIATIVGLTLCLADNPGEEISAVKQEIFRAALDGDYEKVFDMFNVGLDDHYLYLDEHDVVEPDHGQLSALLCDAKEALETNEPKRA